MQSTQKNVLSRQNRSRGGSRAIDMKQVFRKLSDDMTEDDVDDRDELADLEAKIK